MRILLLGPKRNNLIQFLNKYGDQVVTTEDSLKAQSEILNDIEFIISYGYRHIIPKDIIDAFPNKIINLHISYLPWNRGSDPNLWSFLEDTQKGVTIHYVTVGLDTGNILLQQQVEYFQNDTLRTMYNRLSEKIENLFMCNWPDIRNGSVRPVPQTGKGSYHKLNDRQQYNYLLIKGWDTPVVELIGKAHK